MLFKAADGVPKTRSEEGATPPENETAMGAETA
jgi:hypothetical protein